jgi:hypothetical protein
MIIGTKPQNIQIFRMGNLIGGDDKYLKRQSHVFLKENLMRQLHFIQVSMIVIIVGVPLATTFEMEAVNLNSKYE